MWTNEYINKIDAALGLAKIREEWEEAANALEKALQAKKLDHPGRASLLLGIANNSRGQIEVAQRAFERAQQYQESRKSAANWLKHIEQRKAQAN